MILRNFISLLAFNVCIETHCGLKFHFGQFGRSEICTEVSFTQPEVMWTLVIKLPHTEVTFYPKVKSQTGLRSLWVSRKRALRKQRFQVKNNSVFSFQQINTRDETPHNPQSFRPKTFHPFKYDKQANIQHQYSNYQGHVQQNNRE